MNRSSFHYIDSDSALRDVASRWQSVPVVALDTEFCRINTFTPIAGLVQLQAAGECYLIDPLAIKDLGPLLRLCTNPDVVKVLHACSEDLEIFDGLLNAVPAPVFDTQIAAALLGAKLSLSYQNLVADLLGLAIPKGETRSDWLQRPLTDSQCQYAALDVSHLLAVYDRQVEMLSREGRMQWVIEDCTRLVKAQRQRQLPDEYYLRLKAAWRLNRRQLLVLKTACSWREHRARQDDRPRNWVVDDRALLALATGTVTSQSDLKETLGMSSSQIKRYGDELLDLVIAAARVPDSSCPETIQRPPGAAGAALIKSLRKEVGEVADRIGLAPEVLAKRRSLEELVSAAPADAGPALPEELQGWRREIIGERLLRVIAGQGGR